MCANIKYYVPYNYSDLKNMHMHEMGGNNVRPSPLNEW